MDAAKLIARVGELVASQKLDHLNNVMAVQLRAQAGAELTGAGDVREGIALELSTGDELEPQPLSEVGAACVHSMPL